MGNAIFVEWHVSEWLSPEAVRATATSFPALKVIPDGDIEMQRTHRAIFDGQRFRFEESGGQFFVPLESKELKVWQMEKLYIDDNAEVKTYLKVPQAIDNGEGHIRRREGRDVAPMLEEVARSPILWFARPTWLATFKAIKQGKYEELRNADGFIVLTDKKWHRKRLRFDPRRDYVPVQLQLSKQTVIDIEYRHFDGIGIAPSKWACVENKDAVPFRTWSVNVIRWANLERPNDYFNFTFPTGTTVFDLDTNHTFSAGERRPTPVSSLRQMLLIANLLVVAVLLFYLLYRKYAARAGPGNPQ